jgi:hypothetical protein
LLFSSCENHHTADANKCCSPEKAQQRVCLLVHLAKDSSQDTAGEEAGARHKLVENVVFYLFDGFNGTA